MITGGLKTLVESLPCIKTGSRETVSVLNSCTVDTVNCILCPIDIVMSFTVAHALSLSHIAVCLPSTLLPTYTFISTLLVANLICPFLLPSLYPSTYTHFILSDIPLLYLPNQFDDIISLFSFVYFIIYYFAQFHSFCYIS